MGVELIQDHPRLDPDGHRVPVHHADPVQVFREIQNQGRADGLAREAGGPPPGDDRRAPRRRSGRWPASTSATVRGTTTPIGSIW